MSHMWITVIVSTTNDNTTIIVLIFICYLYRMKVKGYVFILSKVHCWSTSKLSQDSVEQDQSKHMTSSQLPMKVDEANLCYGDGSVV